MSAFGLVPVGLPAAEEDLMATLERQVAATFELPVERLAALPEPEKAHDPLRGQWDSTAYLRLLAASLPAGVVRLLGVTDRDLFVPVLSFVFGQAQLDGPAAVISLARLRQEFHGLPPQPAITTQRAVKEALHELGHTVGLVHCVHSSCPMSLSVDIRQLDAKGARFCARCSILRKEGCDMVLQRMSGAASGRAGS